MFRSYSKTEFLEALKNKNLHKFTQHYKDIKSLSQKYLDYFLYIATINQYKEIIEFLLEEGANPNQCQKNGDCPLDVALQLSNLELVKLMAEYGADFTHTFPDGTNPLFIAASKGAVEIVEEILKDESVDINQRHSINETTPLWNAAKCGHKSVVKLLIERGADTQLKALGCTAYRVAIEMDHDDVAELLPPDWGRDAQRAEIIDAMHDLGYGKFANRSGVCKGIANTVTQSILADDYDTYLKRHLFIKKLTQAQLLAEIKRVLKKRLDLQEKYTSKIANLTEEEINDSLCKAIKNDNVSDATKKRIKHLLANEESLDDERLLENKKQYLMQAKTEDNLTKLDKIILGIPAYFECIGLHHYPYKHTVYYKNKDGIIQFIKKLFTSRRLLHYQDDRAFQLTLPEKLKNKGGICDVARFSGVYNENEMKNYFELLISQLEEHQIDFPVVLRLSSGTHAIAVFYDREKGIWNIITHDIVAIATREHIGKAIVDILSSHDYAIISTKVTVSRNNRDKMKQCSDDWMSEELMQNMHKPTPEKSKVMGESRTTWVQIAEHEGDVELTKTLLKQQSIFKRHKYTIGLMSTTGFVMAGATVALGLILAPATFGVSLTLAGMGMAYIFTFVMGGLLLAKFHDSQVVNTAKQQHKMHELEEKECEKKYSTSKIVKAISKEEQTQEKEEEQKDEKDFSRSEISDSDVKNASSNDESFHRLFDKKRLSSDSISKDRKAVIRQSMRT